MIIKIKTLVFCENFTEYGDVHVMAQPVYQYILAYILSPLKDNFSS